MSLWCKNVLFVSIFPHFAHLFRRPRLGEGAQHLQHYNSVQNQMSGCICQPSFHTNSALQGKISAQDLWLGCFSAHQEWWGILSTALKQALSSLKDPNCDTGPKVTEKPFCVVTIVWLRALSGGWGKLSCHVGIVSIPSRADFLIPFSSSAIPRLLCFTWEGSYTWAGSKYAASSVPGRNHISLLRFHSLYGWHGEPLRNGANRRITCAVCPRGIFFAFSCFSRK